MRILLVASGYRPHIGGLQTAVEQIASRLQACGQSVLVVTNRYPRSLPSREILNGIRVFRMLFLFPRLQQLRNARLDLFLAGLWYCPVTLLRLFLLINRYKPDVVNLHYVGSPTLFVLSLYLVRHFPLVVSLHGGDVDGEPLKNRFNRWMFCAITERAGVVTTCSDFLVRQATEYAPDIMRKCVVIRNGVDIELFSKAPAYKQDRPYLFCVGQLETHKGFDVAISAFAQLQNDFPVLDLLIGGIGSQERALARAAGRLGLGSKVKLLGRLDHSQIASYMRGSSAVLIPSRREPLGIVALEARTANSRIVASNVGGLVEALDGYPAWWVIPNSADELRRAIVSLLSGQMPDTARVAPRRDSHIEVLSWDQASEKYFNLYKVVR